jgi:IS605 OrfB family transposase
MRTFNDHERFLVNLAVEQYNFASRYRAYRAHPDESVKSRQLWPHSKERMAQLTELRAELDWLRDGSQTAQQQAIRVVDRAYANWKARPDHFRRPTFRGKDADTQGFGLSGVGKNFAIRQISRKWGEVRIPKAGWIRFRLTVPWERVAGAKSVRFTIDRCQRWHVSFPGPQPEVERVQTGAIVGIDRGVANTLATSDGAMDHAPTLTPGEAERLLRLERHLPRQQKGSRSRERNKRAKARVTTTLVDRRKAWVEESTTNLIRSYDVIVVEHLKIKNMTKSAKGTKENPGVNVAAKRGLNRSILAQCWGQWLQRLKEKAATCGVLVVEVSPRNTSRECHSCGHTTKDNRQSQALFICVACGYERHADINAADNILDRGMKKLGLADGHAVTAHGALVSTGAVKCEAPEAA